MGNSLESIKDDLKQLCEEYIDILEQLKKDNIISDDLYNKCSENKIMFIGENN